LVASGGLGELLVQGGGLRVLLVRGNDLGELFFWDGGRGLGVL
jgi:hypothetical protein